MVSASGWIARAKPLARRLPPPLLAPARSATDRALRLGRRPLWSGLRRLPPLCAERRPDDAHTVFEHYASAFFDHWRDDIRGRVLAARDAGYITRFGGSAVEASEIVDHDPENTAATIIADLAEPGSLPGRLFDCVVLADTLPFMANPEVALENAWRVVNVGGCLLVTARVVDRADGERHALWSFTGAGLSTLAARALPGADLWVGEYGNLLTAVATLYGVDARELKPGDLDRRDPRYPVLVAARARKRL